MSAVKRLVLVDAQPLLYRVIHSSRSSSSDQYRLYSDKLSDVQVETTALSAFCHTIMSLHEDFAPTHLAVALDSYTPTLERRERFPPYKRNRDNKNPTEEQIEAKEHLKWCVKQFPEIGKLVSAPSVYKERHEADDIIGTYTQQAIQENPNNEVIILSNDSDFVQLLNLSPNVKIITHNMSHPKNEIRTQADLGQRFREVNIKLEQFLDYRALMGDASDNIPGCPGVGPKRAALLLNQHGNLESILNEAKNLKKSKMRDNLIEYADQIRLCREIVELRKDLDGLLSFESLEVKFPGPKEIEDLAEPFEFNLLAGRLKDLLLTRNWKTN